MDTRCFWDLIEEAGRRLGPERLRTSYPYAHDGNPLTDVLVARHLSDEQLQKFGEIFDDIARQLADTHGMEDVADHMGGGVSDDSFEYFLCWIIVQGEEVTSAALDDPQSLIAYVNGRTGVGYGAEVASYAAEYANRRLCQHRRSEQERANLALAETHQQQLEDQHARERLATGQALTVESVIARGEQLLAQVRSFSALDYHPGMLTIADDAPAYIAVLGERFDRHAEKIEPLLQQLRRMTVFFATKAERDRWRAQTQAALQAPTQPTADTDRPQYSRQELDQLHNALSFFGVLQDIAVADNAREMSQRLHPLEQLCDSLASHVKICQQVEQKMAAWRQQDAAGVAQ